MRYQNYTDYLFISLPKHKHLIKFFARYQQQMIICISDDSMESDQYHIRNKTF